VGRGREGAAAGKRRWVVAEQGVGQPPRAAWVAVERELARPGSWCKRGQQQELSRADRDARAAKVAGPYLVRGEKRKGEIWLRVGLWYGYLVDLLKSLGRTEA
jgi:hypothetical protein